MYWQFCGSFSTSSSARGGSPHGAKLDDEDELIGGSLAATIRTHGMESSRLKSNAQHSVFVIVKYAKALGSSPLLEDDIGGVYWNGTKPPVPPATVSVGQSGSGGGSGIGVGKQSCIASAAAGTAVSESQLSSGIGKIQGTSHFSTSKTGFCGPSGHGVVAAIHAGASRV